MAFTWLTENATSLSFGIVEIFGLLPFSLTGNFSTSFANAGTYTARIEVVGSSGATADDEIILTVTEPATDSEWSSLLSRWPLLLLTASGPFLEEMTPPTTDGPWSAIITTLSLDGPWSAIITTPTRDGPWSSLVDVLTTDGPWSTPLGLLTQDGPWSDLYGPLICDSSWSPFATLGTMDGPWSVPIGALSLDGPWSTLIGPIICDSLWSPFAVLDMTQDGPWSVPIPTLTTDGPWSAPVGTGTEDGPWSDLVEAVLNGFWTTSNLAYYARASMPQSMLSNGLWSAVAGAAFRPRPGAIQSPAYDGAWSTLSNTAYSARASSLIFIVYHGAWQLSNLAYRRRQHDAALIIGNGGWGGLSNAAFQARAGPSQLVIYAKWSIVSNTTHEPRAAVPAQIVYHSEWSPVSNVARQEREVLSAIGGAIPFLHIYEARRGLVEVKRLVDSVSIFVGMGLEEAPVDTDRDNDRVIINPRITVGDLREGDTAVRVYRTSETDIGTPPPFRFYLANMEGVDPNIQRVYYDVTPNALLTGILSHSIEAAATATGISYQKKTSDGGNDGAIVEFSFGGVAVGDGVEFVVIALTPQHDNERLSRIVYRQARVNNWYYYHGVPEVYVSDPLVSIVAAMRKPSPTTAGTAPTSSRRPMWGMPLRWSVSTRARTRPVVRGSPEPRACDHRPARPHTPGRDEDGNYGKDFTGILQSPPLQHQRQHLRLACNAPGPHYSDGPVLRQLRHAAGPPGRHQRSHYWRVDPDGLPSLRRPHGGPHVGRCARPRVRAGPLSCPPGLVLD